MTAPSARWPVRTHGYGGYADGCRCGICRAGKAAYMREYRAERAQRRDEATAAGRPYVAAGITHGTNSGYRDAKCRCAHCRAAWNASHLRRRGGEAAVSRRREHSAREAALEAMSYGRSGGFEALYAAALAEELEAAVVQPSPPVVQPDTQDGPR